MKKKMGIQKGDKVILAGAFGSYRESAMTLGMFPDCDIEMSMPSVMQQATAPG